MPTNLYETENDIPCVEIYGIISASFKVRIDLHCCHLSRMTHKLQGFENHEPLDSVKDGKFIK
jgi:hypothetical protein